MAKSKSTRKRLIFRPELLLKLYGKDEFIRGMVRMLDLLVTDERREILDCLIRAVLAAEREAIKRPIRKAGQTPRNGKRAVRAACC